MGFPLMSGFRGLRSGKSGFRGLYSSEMVVRRRRAEGGWASSAVEVALV